MPRPKKEGLVYFPLDVNFFENDKIEDLRWTCGSLGILTYINLLCRMYSNRYFIEFSDRSVLERSIARDIACDQLKKTMLRVHETINYLVNQGTLDRCLFEQGVISGRMAQEQYILSAAKARWEIKMDVYRLVDVLEVLQKNRVSVTKTMIIVTETGVIDAVGTQSKDKEKSKEKEKDISLTTTDKGCPLLSEIYLFFKNELNVGDALQQAQKFEAYNKARGWDCLPDWKAAAKKWEANTFEQI